MSKPNGRSELVSVRLTYEMLDELRALAVTLDRPYQAVMKEAISLGIEALIAGARKRKGGPGERSLYSAANLEAAFARLRK